MAGIGIGTHPARDESHAAAAAGGKVCAQTVLSLSRAPHADRRGRPRRWRRDRSSRVRAGADQTQAAGQRQHAGTHVEAALHSAMAAGGDWAGTRPSCNLRVDEGARCGSMQLRRQSVARDHDQACCDAAPCTRLPCSRHRCSTARYPPAVEVMRDAMRAIMDGQRRHTPGQGRGESAALSGEAYIWQLVRPSGSPPVQSHSYNYHYYCSPTSPSTPALPAQLPSASL